MRWYITLTITLTICALWQIGKYNVLSTSDIVYFQPEMVHLSVSADGSVIYFTWSTWNNTLSSEVEYGKDLVSINNVATGISTRFEDDGNLQRQQYIHRVEVTDLDPDTVYYYRVGSRQAWSVLYWLKTRPTAFDWKPRLSIFGDLGNENATALPRLQQETQSGMYDMILHLGDFAYDLHTDNGIVGDEFMTQIETIAAYIPYMVCPGNHDEHGNFSHYKNRFTMPNYTDTENMYYSFTVGPMKIISIDTEAYYYPEYGYEKAERQFNWFLEELQSANEPTNRGNHPWLIVVGHRPMYCSVYDEGYEYDCSNNDTLIQTGLPGLGLALEVELIRYNVDLAIWAHMHNYERMYPVFNYTVMNGTVDEPYVNPKAPVHITTGSAGNNEGQIGFLPDQPEYTAFRSVDYGTSKLIAHNATHLEFIQISDTLNGAIIDRIWIVSDEHNFNYTN